MEKKKVTKADSIIEKRGLDIIVIFLIALLIGFGLLLMKDKKEAEILIENEEGNVAESKPIEVKNEPKEFKSERPKGTISNDVLKTVEQFFK